MPTQFPPAFDAYVEPARERSEIWRTLLGLGIFVLLFLVFAIILVTAIYFIREWNRPYSGAQLLAELLNGHLHKFMPTLVSAAGITMFIPALWIVTRFLHKRSLFSLISPSQKIDWRLWQIGAITITLILCVSVALSFATGDLTQQYTISKWIPVALLMVVITFFQTAAEELLFRGYILQQLAARFQSRWIWLVLPSVAFGAAHYQPALFGNNAILVVLHAALLGIVAGDLTARLGNLSAAMGLHFANNAIALILVGAYGQLSGAALYVERVDLKSTATGVGIAVGMVIMLAIYGGFLMVWKRRRL